MFRIELNDFPYDYIQIKQQDNQVIYTFTAPSDDKNDSYMFPMKITYDRNMLSVTISTCWNVDNIEYHENLFSPSVCHTIEDIYLVHNVEAVRRQELFKVIVTPRYQLDDVKDLVIYPVVVDKDDKFKVIVHYILPEYHN